MAKDLGAPYRIDHGPQGTGDREYKSAQAALMALAAWTRRDPESALRGLPSVRIVNAMGRPVSKLSVESGFAGVPLDKHVVRTIENMVW